MSGTWMWVCRLSAGLNGQAPEQRLKYTMLAGELTEPPAGDAPYG